MNRIRTTLKTPRDSPANSADDLTDAPSFVHPTAIVHEAARIGRGCHVGPYCVVGADVALGNRVRLESHCHIDGRTIIGDDTHLFPFTSVGLAPQDLKYKGEPSETRVGQRVQVREFVTIHRGTEGGGMVTEVGDDCLLMAQAHVAHDCRVGDQVIMANGATLAGHVSVARGATIGAYSGVHQFCRVGREAFVGGYSVVVKDALPFARTVGNHARCYGLNSEGFRRRGYPRATRDALHHTFRLLLSSRLNTSQALERIEAEITGVPEVAELVAFIKSSERGVVK